MMGGITNIDQQGFSSAAFHAWPDMMKWDPYSGDYGMGFYGHAIASATYVVDHPTLGWLGFGGDVSAAKGSISITPIESARARLLLAPEGQWNTLEAGKIASPPSTPAPGRIERPHEPPHT